MDFSYFIEPMLASGDASHLELIIGTFQYNGNSFSKRIGVYSDVLKTLGLCQYYFAINMYAAEPLS